jgi:hypothetical protein
VVLEIAYEELEKQTNKFGMKQTKTPFGATLISEDDMDSLLIIF